MEIRVCFFFSRNNKVHFQQKLSSFMFIFLLFLCVVGSLSILMLLLFWGKIGGGGEMAVIAMCGNLFTMKKYYNINIISIVRYLEWQNGELPNNTTCTPQTTIPYQNILDIYGFQFLSNLIFLSLYCFICDFFCQILLCVFILFVYIYSRV